MFRPLHRVLFNFAHFETLRKLKKGPNTGSGVLSLIKNVNLGLRNGFGAPRKAPSSASLPFQKEDFWLAECDCRTPFSHKLKIIST
jgi:hypothetical protein